MQQSSEHDDKRRVAEKHLDAVPGSTPTCPADRGYGECPCPDDCSIQGECRLCTAFHLQQGRLPFCQRSAEA